MTEKSTNSGWFRTLGLGAAAGTVGLLATMGTAFAEDAAAPTLNSGDTAWMLTSTALVLMMTIPGVALFYGGMVRKKNIVTMAAQTFMICCLASVLWTVVGYSIAFRDGGSMQAYIGGLDRLFLVGLEPTALFGTIPESLFMVFQMTFAIITPALIIGAFADRMKFGSLIAFISLWLIVIYAPIAHWVWGGGFLGGLGVLDYAGGTVVHINAGIAGLVGCLVHGPRKGYGHENMAPHNVLLTMIGAALLWVGWFGFNAGSALSAGTGASMAMVVTQIATAMAALAWMTAEWLVHKKPTLLGLCSGAVAGLVAITPAAGFVDPVGALWIGLFSGLICFWAATSLKKALGYDDSLDVFGVHGVGGIVGAILTGVFAVSAVGGKAGGLEGNWGQVIVQIEGVVATIVWSGIGTFVLLMIVKAIFGLRVTPQEEVEGLDISLHGETIQ